MMHAPLDERAAFVERRAGFRSSRVDGVRGRRRQVRDQARAVAAHREERGEALARREDVELVVGPVGVGLQIGEQIRLIEGLAVEADAEPMPHEAVRAVRGDHDTKAAAVSSRPFG